MYTPFILLSALAATALAAPITDSSPRGLVDTLTGTAGSVVGGATNAAGDLLGGVTGAAGDLTSSAGLKKERGLLDGATGAVGSVVDGATGAVGDLVGDVGLKERGLVDGLLGGLTGGSSTSTSAGAASTGAASSSGGLLVGSPHLQMSLRYRNFANNELNRAESFVGMTMVQMTRNKMFKDYETDRTNCYCWTNFDTTNWPSILATL